MKNKIAIVTGGTGALGRQVANKLADEGIRVYVPAHNMDEFNSVFDNSQSVETSEFRLRKIYAFECDALDENSVREFVRSVSVQEKGGIDFLINTVGGINPVCDVADTLTSDFDSMFNLNFRSAFFFSREVLKIMRPRKYGRIISISAMAGLEAAPGRFSYSFSKAGVVSLMNTISEEMKGYNIRCSTIVPSVIDTPANREWGSPEDINKWVKPAQIANIIYGLLTDEFSPVRSSIIKVYGSV